MNTISRRDFIRRSVVAGSAVTMGGAGALRCHSAGLSSCSVVIFSKIYQEIKLSFDDAAAVTAESGLDGIDCPVRPGGEISPERAVDELPRYAESLRQRSLQVPLLTTGITNLSSAHAEDVLRTAKKLGIEYYRLGFYTRQKNVPVDKQLAEIKAQLKDVAAMNQAIGITGLFQNHSSSGRADNIGGDLTELRQVVSDFNPAQIGAAFDIGHAIIVHGDEWRTHFDKLKSHLKIVYLKDPVRQGRFVRFGEGEISKTDYLKLLKEIRYQAPISMHIEFDWTDNGAKTRVAMVKTLKESTKVVRRWMAEA